MISIYMLIDKHLISEHIQCLVIQLQMNDSINSTRRIENKTTKRKSSLKPNTNSILIYSGIYIPTNILTLQKLLSHLNILFHEMLIKLDNAF